MKLRFAILTLSFACLGAAAAADWSLQQSQTLGQPGPHADLVEKTFVNAEGETRQLYLILFDDRHYDLAVVDRSSRSDGLNLEKAMDRGGFLAGVNAGYFHRDFRPVGMVVTEGRVVQEPERARLLSGVIDVGADGIRLLRHAEYEFGDDTKNGLQSGPFLIDEGKPVAGLEATRAARRTFIGHDGAHRWVLGMSHPFTLNEMAEVLNSAAVRESIHLQRALNLDGGGSSAIWARLPGNDFYIPGPTSVRNYLGIRPR